MTVTSTTSKVSYNGSGSTGPFPITYRFTKNADIVVTKRSTTGTEATLTLTTDYTLTGAGDPSGGELTLVSALATGDVLVIARVPGITQEVDYVENAAFPAETHEGALDRLTMICQSLREQVDRSVKVEISSTTNPDDLLVELAADVASAASNASIATVQAGLATNAKVAAEAAAASIPRDALSAANNLSDLVDKPTARGNIGAARQPGVTMIRSANSTNDTLTSAAWKVYDENGAEISTVGTTTEGLQEAINYAARYGYDLFVYGGGIKPLKWGVPYGGALGANPFATTSGSNIVTVTHASHGLSTGDKVTFNGLAGEVNGIPQAQLQDVEKVVAVVDANSYTITTTSNATSTASGGGASVRYQHSGQDVAIINCTTGIDVPPVQGVRWDIHATINFGGAGGTPGIDFDSVMASDIKISGQIVCSSGYIIGIRFKPTAELPQDPYGPAITSTNFEISSVVMAGGGGVCIDMDATAGAISSNVFKFIEPNDGATGIRVQVGASTTFDHNHIDAVDIHSQDKSIDDGGSATNATNIFGNTWNVQLDTSTSGVGVDMYGQQNKWTISVTNLEGNPSTGVTLNTSAKKNIIEFLRNDATTKINDAAVEKSNVIIAPRSMVRANKNGTNQTGIVTATPTDVTFGTEVIDTLGEFDGTTFTATWSGTYMISARIGWVTAVDATPLSTSILKSGTAVFDGYTYASGTGGSQGSDISACLELAAGDTIKIRARQDSGSNQDISGVASVTWLSIARI